MWAPDAPTYRVGWVPRAELEPELVTEIEQIERETGETVKVWRGRDGNLVTVRFPPRR